MRNLQPHRTTAILTLFASSVGNVFSKAKTSRVMLKTLSVSLLVIGMTATSFANRSIKFSETSRLQFGQDIEVELIYVNPNPEQSVLEFNLLISFPTEVMGLVQVTPTPFDADCGWDYFDVSQPLDSLIRILARAEPGAGNCLNTDSVVLATIKFHAVEDSAAACQGGKIAFVWQDCGDNLFALEDGSGILAVDSMFWHPPGNYFPPYPRDPGTTDSCVAHVGGVRAVNFYSEDVGLICPYYHGPKGDFNQNDLQYEIADYVLFANYFMDGPAAFGAFAENSWVAGDINADGFPLQLTDLVWMHKVIIGDTLKLPRLVAADTVQLIQDLTAKTVSIDYDPGLAALFVKFVGEITPAPLFDTSDGVRLGYGFDGTHTRVMIKYPLVDMSLIDLPSGPVFSYTGNGNIVAYELTDWTTATLPSILLNTGGSCCTGTTGNIDCDLSDLVDIGDLTMLIGYLFISNAPLCCPNETNIDGQGEIDVGDLNALIDYLFISRTLPTVCP